MTIDLTALPGAEKLAEAGLLSSGLPRTPEETAGMVEPLMPAVTETKATKTRTRRATPALAAPAGGGSPMTGGSETLKEARSPAVAAPADQDLEDVFGAELAGLRVAHEAADDAPSVVMTEEAHREAASEVDQLAERLGFRPIDRETFFGGFRAVFEFSGGVTQLRSLPIRPTEMIGARATSDAIYDIAATTPGLSWMLDAENNALMKWAPVAMFVTGKMTAVLGEVKERRLAAIEAEKAANAKKAAKAAAPDAQEVPADADDPGIAA